VAIMLILLSCPPQSNPEALRPAERIHSQCHLQVLVHKEILGILVLSLSAFLVDCQGVVILLLVLVVLLMQSFIRRRPL
jgi:hypothetical protein